MSWTIDGFAGYMMIHKQPFSATNHRGILVPKTDKVNLDYLKYVMELMFRELKKGARVQMVRMNTHHYLPL